MNFYALYDLKAGYFLPVLEAHGDDHAKRTVADAIRQGNEQLAIHRNDYVLYCLGTWDNKAGKIAPYDTPDLVASVEQIVSEYFKQPEQTDVETYPDVTVEEMQKEKDDVYNDTPIPDDS